VDPQKKKETPDFYGYIPDGGSRTVIFGCMMLQSALLLLIRSLSAAMLMLVKKRYLAMYMAGDVALYLLQKVARGDFHYWPPIDGAVGLLVSLMMRVFVKILVDFTGVIQFRGPQELGGLYWTVNIFLALLASFVCVWVGGGGATEWTLVLAASGAFSSSFGLFLLLIKKEYWRTFVDTQTGRQQTTERFIQAVEDSVKASVMKKNKKQWAGIREDVMAWVFSNFWRWEAEKPEWYTESWIATLFQADAYRTRGPIAGLGWERTRRRGSECEVWIVTIFRALNSHLPHSQLPPLLLKPPVTQTQYCSFFCLFFSSRPSHARGACRRAT